MNGSREPSAEVVDPHISDSEANSIVVPRFPRSRSKQESADPGSTKTEATPYVYLESHRKSPEAEEVMRPPKGYPEKKAAPAGRFPNGESHTPQTTAPRVPASH